MIQDTEQHGHALPRHGGRAARVARRTGWVLLVLISMAVIYGMLVFQGH